MKFSIITPSFNQAQFITQTIDSVINQTGEFEIEYFVMDGGSADGTVDILKQYASKLKNNPNIKFHWHSAPDDGQSSAINTALSKVTGDIVAYINSDDYYFPNTFSLVTNYFVAHPNSSWVVGNCRISDYRLAWTFFLKHLWPIQLHPSFLHVFNTINQPSVFLKTELVKKIGNFDTTLRYAFDYDYWLRCLQHSLPGRLWNDLSVFRIHPDSKGNTGFQKQFDEDWKVVNRYHPNLVEKFLHLCGRKFTNLIYAIVK